MKNIKLVAKILLLVLLLTTTFNFVACSMIVHDWEVYSHDEFVKKIEEFNRINDGSVDTFISFDFDSNEDITKKMYAMQAVANSFKTRIIGLVDILDPSYTIYQVFYLKQEDNSNEYAYKIKINCDSSDTYDYNFTEDDKIEIVKLDNHPCGYDHNNKEYEESLIIGAPILMYNYCYEYGLYVNDVEIGCIHISSIDETSEEKLDGICQLLLDNIVIINTEG